MKKALFLFKAGLLFCFQNFSLSQDIDINGPVGSGSFGQKVTVLTNGNFVVADPEYDQGGLINIGAVYLYNGVTKALISTLKGSNSNDNIGSDGVIALTNGNFVVVSPLWFGSNRGAVTWGNGTTGISGVVSATNSLVGASTDDKIGSTGVIALNNGNYVVRSMHWHNGTAIDAGAVSWGNGTSGTSGVVSSANSLVGSSANDKIGYWPLEVLNNGNYVIASFYWDNGSQVDAGAVAWGNGSSGISGVISASNALIGSSAGDQVGYGGVEALTNGNYVVTSFNWDNGNIIDVGAATWGNGSTGITGIVSPANSLVGANANDKVGISGVTALTNGNYVVRSPSWNNGVNSAVGAATWGNGTTGTLGVVSAANSLIGSAPGDKVGHYSGLKALTNGNYVVTSPYWDNGNIIDAGAATWGNGSTGTTGIVSSANSLVGSSADDRVGINAVAPLTNGNYVVASPEWNNGSTANAGAATWGNGSTGVTGIISSANSLIGLNANNEVGTQVTPLTNGNYVVTSPDWKNGTIVHAGAATWGNGSTGTTGIVSSANSLVGSTANDQVGINGVNVLTNSNYVVTSPNWDNGNTIDAGAATWGNGSTGATGIVSSANSLVGSSADDQVGEYGVTALSNGNYVVKSPNWNNGTVADAGAVTWANGTSGISGVVTNTNSLTGLTAYDQVGYYFVVELYEGYFVGQDPVMTLSNGNYVVQSQSFNNGNINNAVAITMSDGFAGTQGPISSCNSVLGEIAGSTATPSIGTSVFNEINNYLIVPKPLSNKLTISNRFILPAASVSISSSDADNNICVGDSVTFTATPTNGGTAPTYKWFVAGVQASGQTAQTFVTTTLLSGQAVSCEISSNEACLSSPVALSPSIVTTVQTLAAPTNLYTTNITNSQAILHWDHVPNATEIEIALRKEGTSDWTHKLDTYADFYTFFPDADFTGGNYKWRVRIKNGNGCWSEYTALTSFYVCNTAAPTALNESNIFQNKVTLNWSHSGADSVRIALRKIGAAWKYKNLAYVNNYIWEKDFGNTPSTYEWMIKVRCGDSWGDWSLTDQFTSSVCNIASPTALNESDVFQNKVTLNWSHYGADSVKIALRKVGAAWKYKNLAYVNNYIWEKEFGNTPSTHEWMIKVRCGNTWGDWSAIDQFMSGTVNGMIVQDPDREKEETFLLENVVLEAYPNPNEGNFTISSSHEASFNIINELGQIIKSLEISKDNAYKVKVTGLAKGVYFVTGIINSEVLTKKIIVQ